jgi:simple sugar transport system substrate-binding protein
VTPLARHLAALLVVLALALAACGGGESSEVRERDIVVEGDGTPAAGTSQREPARERGGVRIVVVTHGEASSNFWKIVRNGVEAGARQVDAVVTYRSPDVYSFRRMRELVDQALRSRPDGLVVSIPDIRLGPSVRRAVRAGIAVVSINSGSDVYRSLGVLAHVGQPEDRAGAGAGRRMAAAGVRNALCVNHEVRNAALDVRCRAFGGALRRAGGRSRVVVIDPNDRGATARTLRQALAGGGIDGVLTLGSDAAQAAATAIARLPRPDDVLLGTFDLSPEVLDGIRAGRISFAVDQQAYLQGYLPIVLLSQLIRYGLFPAQGDVLPTGPNFVTRDNAAQVIRLARQAIR